jgi:ATP-dependent RNA helicase DDX24/MAK5
MSRTAQKRSKSTEIPNSSRKRCKVDGLSKMITRTKTASGPFVATFSANELSWREVTPPERLDDAEGFLGLEEIDDIEVVRDEKGNHTHFRVYIK